MILETFSLAQVGLAPGGFSMTYILIIGVSMLASFIISNTLKRRFTEYSQIPIRMTGAQVAEMMLRQNGIRNVVNMTKGIEKPSTPRRNRRASDIQAYCSTS